MSEHLLVLISLHPAINTCLRDGHCLSQDPLRFPLVSRLGLVEPLQFLLLKLPFSLHLGLEKPAHQLLTSRQVLLKLKQVF